MLILLLLAVGASCDESDDSDVFGWYELLLQFSSNEFRFILFSNSFMCILWSSNSLALCAAYKKQLWNTFKLIWTNCE